MSHPAIRRATALLALLAGLLAGVVTALAVSPGAAAPSTPSYEWVPPDNTIVRVEGNRYDGFGVFFYDGSAIFPPTDSEALAECEEYDTRVAVVRCKTGVRVWYRDLGQLRRALRYAHSA
jgi:hypothetical protein